MEYKPGARRMPRSSRALELEGIVNNARARKNLEAMRRNERRLSNDRRDQARARRGRR